jgi:hypothetical protein
MNEKLAVDDRCVELTPRQRMVRYMSNAFANDLSRGNEAEQRTSALLCLAVDAMTRGYEGELVAVAVEWRLRQENAGLRIKAGDAL